VRKQIVGRWLLCQMEHLVRLDSCVIFLIRKCLQVWVVLRLAVRRVDFLTIKFKRPVPVAARSKAYVYGRSPAEIVGSNPNRGMDVCLL